MSTGWFATGAVAGGLAVVLGAFGAHGLKSRVSAEMLDVFETGVRYHLFHALALMAVSWLAAVRPGRGPVLAGWCFLVGVVIFSGSLYLMVLTDARWLGAITPVGGVALVAGWAVLAWTALH